MILSGLLAACNDNGPDDPGSNPDGGGSGGGSGNTGAAVEIQLHMRRAPLLVAVQDGAGAPWQAVTAAAATPTSFTATVHGPYLVTVVCPNSDIAASAAVTTWQAGRTPGDAHEVTAPCDPVPATGHAIKVSMVQAGQITLGSSLASSTTPSWQGTVAPAAGTSDLIATSADRIVIQRGIAIGATLPTEIPVIDADQTGTPLVAAPLTVTNPGAHETVQSLILLATANNPNNATIYFGPPAGTKIAPAGAPVIATDAQQAAIVASDVDSERSLRRPFHVGSTAAFTLPTQIANGRWTVTQGELAAHWDALPPIDTLIARVSGHNGVSSAPIGATLELSAAYITARAITQVAIDTAIPGYQPAWKLEPAVGFQATLEADRTVGGEVASSELFTTVAPGAAPQP